MDYYDGTISTIDNKTTELVRKFLKKIFSLISIYLQIISFDISRYERTIVRKSIYKGDFYRILRQQIIKNITIVTAFSLFFSEGDRN